MSNGVPGRKIVSYYMPKIKNIRFSKNPETGRIETVSKTRPRRQVNRTVSIRILQIASNTLFSKKNTKIKECHSTANPGTQKMTLLKKSKSTVPYRTLKFFRFFLPPKCREVYEHRRRFPTPYPSREGLYGVRYPNTLK